MAMKRQYCTILPEVYWVATWTGLPEGDEHLQQKTSRDSSAGPLLRNGNRRELPGERGLPCPDDVTQQQWGNTLNQRALKDINSLWFSIAKWSVLV